LGLKVLQVLSKPGVMFGVLSVIEAFLFQTFMLLAEFRRALLEADVLLVRGFRRVPHVLTVRTQETPCPSVFVHKDGLGPVATGTVGIQDPSNSRSCHKPLRLQAQTAGALYQSEQPWATNLQNGHTADDCAQQHTEPLLQCVR
jgi:hypothetical protein